MPMKTKVFAMLLAVLLLAGCSEDPGPQMGCMTGIPKVGDPVRTFMRCCTKQEYLAGNNVERGGISYFSNYTDHEWKPVSDCSKCD